MHTDKRIYISTEKRDQQHTRETSNLIDKFIVDNMKKMANAPAPTL
jgi:hypothetical protein